MASVPHDSLHEILGSARVAGDNALGICSPDGPELGVKFVRPSEGQYSGHNMVDLSAAPIAALPLQSIASIQRAVKGAPHC